MSHLFETLLFLISRDPLIEKLIIVTGITAVFNIGFYLIKRTSLPKAAGYIAALNLLLIISFIVSPLIYRDTLQHAVGVLFIHPLVYIFILAPGIAKLSPSTSIVSRIFSIACYLHIILVGILSFVGLFFIAAA